jgi:hypothetical protein
MVKKTSLKKAEEKKEVKETKARMGFYLVAGFVVGVIILYFLFSIIFSNAPFWLANASSFKYYGLEFSKENNQGIDLFHHTYYVKNKLGETMFRNNVYLRIDPRKNEVPVEGKLIFEGDKDIFITINTTGFLKCKDILRDSSFLPTFFINNLFNVSIAIADEEEAQKSKISYVNCETNPKKKVIYIQTGNQTRIKRDGNCYNVVVANCELLSAAEKLQVRALIDAKEAYGNQTNGLFIVNVLNNR